jgi:uncharacterized protein
MSRAGIVDQLAAFSGTLRGRGLTVTSEQTTDMARAMGVIDMSRRAQVRSALRSLAVTDPNQVAVFDDEFDVFFGRRTPTTPDATHRQEAPTRSSTPLLEALSGTATADVAEEGGASAVERVGHRDFADLDDDELAEARRLVTSMSWSPTSYKTRRWVSGEGPRPDLRRTLHGAVGPTGDLMELRWKRRRRRERPLIVIADISGSMERYADLFLVFAHAAQRRLRDVEVFTFSTELTRITEDLARRDTRAALARVSRHVDDWSGGTMIGDALGTWNKTWSRRLARGGPVVLLLSDGWDCGDPALLSSEMARLSRSVHRVIWLNPLAGRADYMPATRGMRAAMPYIDELLPAASVNDLKGVIGVLESMSGMARA